MLSTTQVQRFRQDGYLKGSQVLTADEVGVLQEEMERVIRDRGNPAVPQPIQIANLTGRAEEPVWQIVNIWQASEPFRELLFKRVLGEEIAQLLNAEEIRLWHDQIQYKPAGVGGVNMWHQDWPYWPILSEPEQVTAWVALDDVDEENGCMSMVPESHLWGNNIEFLHTLGKDFEAMPRQWNGREITIRTCPVPAGHVHYHHGLTWHGSNRNRSGRKRRAIAMHFMSNRTRYKAGGMHVMKKYVRVADGEVLTGDAFPLVYSRAGAYLPAGAP